MKYRRKYTLYSVLNAKGKKVVQSANFEHKIRHFETKSGNFDNF